MTGSDVLRLFLRDWQVAYRLKPVGSIFEDKTTPFTVIPNTRRYAAADPFVFEKNGVKYIFAELFDKKEDIGKIGYCVFNNGTFSKWKVIISEPYHLSYPNIFEYDGEIYIVPESNESGELYSYRASEFPDKWDKLSPIIENRKLVDTTFLDYNGIYLMFTYDIASGAEKKLYLYSVDESGKIDLLCRGFISNDDSCARPGGNFFQYNGNIVRVSQDCKKDYGAGVVFSEVAECSRDRYLEKEIMRVYPEDIILNKRFVSGLHTYNADYEMEVIDFHAADFSPITQIRRVKNKLRKRK